LLNGNIYKDAGEHVYYNQLGNLESFNLVIHSTFETNAFELVDYGAIVNGIPLFSDTTFTSILQSINGCDSTVSIKYIVDESTSTWNSEPENIFTIFPNPTSGEF